ncbi:MAG: hypothetical protein WAL72_09145 [Streptosporangiaceae bacterium]
MVAFWVIVTAVTGSVAAKLKGAETNQASAYLPAAAQSTQELSLQSRFAPPDLNPAIVVYTRSSGITAADLRKAAADARRFAALPAVHGRVTGPVVSADHRAIETVVGASLGFSSNLSGFVGHLRAAADPRRPRPGRARGRAGGPGRG